MCVELSMGLDASVLLVVVILNLVASNKGFYQMGVVNKLKLPILAQ